MAMAEINLAIDVDTSSVIHAEEAFRGLDGRLRDASGRFVKMGGAAGDADKRLRRVGDATYHASQRTKDAIAQYQKLTAVWASLGALVGGAMLGGLAGLSDQYTEIINKLRVVSDAQTDVNALFEQLLDVANRTRTPIEAMATLYQRVSLAANELGASQAQILQFSENIGKALALQGGSAEAASGALLQLSQALGGGVVRAEEFNSVLEGAFPIAQAAAKGIEAAGGSVAKLRNLVIDGKVSSSEFFQAILSQTAELEAAFAKTTPTISGAFTVLRNNMVALSKESQGVMGLLAQGIILVAENLERLATYAATAAVVFAGKFAVGLAMAAVEAGTLTGALTVLKGAMITTGIGALIVGAGELVHQFLQLVKATGGWGEALSLLGEVADGVWEGIKTSAQAIPAGLSGVWSAIKAEFFLMVGEIINKWAGLLEYFNVDATNAIAKAEEFRKAAAAAQADRDEAFAEAGAGFSKGFDEALSALGKLRDKVKETEGGLGGAAGAASNLGSSLDKAAGSAKKVGDGLDRAKDVLGDQLREHERLRTLINGEKVETGYVADERQKLLDALDKSGMSLEEFLRKQAKSLGLEELTVEQWEQKLRETEKFGDELDRQSKAAEALVDSLMGLAFGTFDSTSQGIGSVLQSLTKGAFGDDLKNEFSKATEGLADEIKKAFSGIGDTGLSSFSTAAIGVGIGQAAAGAMQGNAGQIGSGIGSAIGGVLGDMAGPAISEAIGGTLGTALGAAAGPVGMVLGSVAGNFVSKLFGSQSSWKSADVTAFAGTSYASDTTVRYNTKNDGASPVARAAMVGTMNLLADFNTELGEYIDSLGGTMQKGTSLVVNEKKALEAITGYADEFDAPRDGRSEQAAAEIAARVSEIMGLAASIAQKAGPQLTNAQQLWRQAQEKFGAENVAILRDLGFSAKQIYQAQQKIRRDLAQGFNKEQLDALVDTGRATKAELDRWKATELAALDDRKKAAVSTAREIGADVALVQSSFRAQRQDIVAQWREMLAEISGATGGVGKATMNRQMLGTLVEGGNAVKWQIDWWKNQELRSIEERRVAAVKAAREAGASTALVNQVFAGERGKIVDRWKELLANLVDETGKAASVTRGERLSFSGSALDELVGGGDTGVLNQWRNVQKALLEIERSDRIAEAKRLGVDVTLISRLYNQKLVDIEKTYAEKRYQAVVDAAASALERLNDRLNGLESQRSEVLQELTQRAEEARRAEQALADARASLAGGDLNPGGPMDRYRALQSQFGDAIKAARGGDTDAASQAASLAQSLLQAGRGVYASGGAYADLFKSVNAQLLAAQRGLAAGATTIEKSLDATTFVETSEKSTKALLTALGRLDSSISRVEQQIARQTRRQELAQQRQSVGAK